VTNPTRARDLAEGADMRQAGGTVAGLEQDIAFSGRRFLETGQQLARLLERPRPRLHRQISIRNHIVLPFRMRRNVTTIPRGSSVTGACRRWSLMPRAFPFIPFCGVAPAPTSLAPCCPVSE